MRIWALRSLKGWFKGSRGGRIIFAAILVYFAAMYVNTAWRAAFGNSDFHIDWDHARGVLLQGQDPLIRYRTDSYPPSFYCLMGPFVLLPFFLAASIWYFLQIGFYISSIFLILGIITYRSEGEYKLGYLSIPPVLTLGLLTDNLSLGQTSVLILFLIVLALYLYLKAKPYQAGFWLALATSLKVTPGLFLLYFLYKRAYKVLIGGGVGLIVFFLVIPSMTYGLGRNFHLLQEWADVVLIPFFKGAPLKTATVSWHHVNQSLDAFLFRSLTPFGVTRYGGLHKLDFITFGVDVLNWLSLGLKVLILGVIAWAARNSLTKNPQLLKFEFSLVLMAMLFISPVAWISHYIVILLPYFVTVAYIVDHHKGDPKRRLLIGSLITAAVLTNINITPHIQSYSGIFIGHLILWWSLAIVLILENYHEKRKQPHEDIHYHPSLQ